MPKILNYGSLNLDYVYQVPHFVSGGETLASDTLKTICGGKGLNQSIAAARAGGNVFHAGKIGSNGNMLRELLEANQINTDFLCQCDSENGHAIIQVDPAAQNCILLFAGSNAKITKPEIDNCLSHFEKGDYLLLQNEINCVPYLIDKAYDKGMQIILNPSPVTKELLSYPFHKISLLILNEVEGKALCDRSEPEEMIAVLREKYPDTRILLSLGEQGAVYADQTEQISVGIYKVSALDTTAAGDTMMGYFTASLAQGKHPKEALLLATKASAIAVSRPGAAPSIPTLKEVEQTALDYLER